MAFHKYKSINEINAGIKSQEALTYQVKELKPNYVGDLLIQGVGESLAIWFYYDKI